MTLEGAREACRLFLSRLSFQVDELLLKRYPGDHPGPKQWLEVIGGVIETAEGYLLSSENGSKTEPETRQLIQDANYLARKSYEFMAMASGTGLDELAYPIVLPLQRWFTQLGLKNSTIFRAELVANYEIRTVQETAFTGIRDKAPRLDSALQAIDWPLIRITVPSKALGMIPHFAVVAHEIGHALYFQVAWDFTSHDTEANATISSIKSQVDATTGPNELNLFIAKVFENWKQEIVADAFGHLLSGPALFFALGGLLQIAGGGLGIGETHPANEIRLKLIHKQLVGASGQSFTGIFKNRLGEELTEKLNSELLPPLPDKATLLALLEQNMKAEPNLSARSKAVVLVELSDYMQLLVKTIYIQATDHLQVNCPNSIYTSGQFDRDIEEHLLPLLQAIPPIESGKSIDAKIPSDFATIINVGWAVMLCRIDELRVRTKDLGSKSQKAEKLHSLLLKAVELSEARRSWEGAV